MQIILSHDLSVSYEVLRMVLVSGRARFRSSALYLFFFRLVVDGMREKTADHVQRWNCLCVLRYSGERLSILELPDRAVDHSLSVSVHCA